MGGSQQPRADHIDVFKAPPLRNEQPASERLRKCFGAGGVLALFPLLADWPESELRALLVDIQVFQESRARGIEALWEKVVFEPSVFLSRERSKAIDQARDEAAVDIFGTCAEIASVALFYLPDPEVEKEP